MPRGSTNKSKKNNEDKVVPPFISIRNFCFMTVTATFAMILETEEVFFDGLKDNICMSFQAKILLTLIQLKCPSVEIITLFISFQKHIQKEK